MRKTLIGLAALLALSGTALAGDLANSHYPKSPRDEAAAPTLDHSTTRSIKSYAADKQSTPAPAPVSSRQIYGDSADGVILPVGNTR
ncbi:hypothetical protein [Mesorhizobium sp. KR1-2]|uniref:hypothetical protein n=1 Tax=Mesorhizobium sp. KR1-2 TaxID=3156609 RepID=UPI0032B4A227